VQTGVDAASTILVQCKRQKEKVPQLVINGLYADMLNENAPSGLIVTTSTLAPAPRRCALRAALRFERPTDPR
jgi:restriction system protein